MVEERAEGTDGMDHTSSVRMKPGGLKEMGELSVERSWRVLGTGLRDLIP